MTPEDSVSEVDSHKTTYTRLSYTSRERSLNAKLKAATKRESLTTEESLLEEIQTEENGVRLEQGKEAFAAENRNC